MAQTVIGFFEKTADAQRAIQRIENIGIPSQDIDLSTSGSSGSGINVDKDQNHVGRSDNSISGFFNTLFGNNTEDADRYSKVSKKGYAMVTVHAQSREQAERAADILDEYGAINVDERAAQVGYTSDHTSSQPITSGRESQSINRIQENLEIGKRTIEQGGVRVHSRIIERPVEEKVRLREERVNVERMPVDRPVTATELNIFQEGDIELIERAEVPVVNKQARVIEEIKISKDVTEHDQIVRDTVRNTEVDIENVNRPETDNNLNSSRTTF